MQISIRVGVVQAMAFPFDRSFTGGDFQILAQWRAAVSGVTATGRRFGPWARGHHPGVMRRPYPGGSAKSTITKKSSGQNSQKPVQEPAGLPTVAIG
jgi:hypothetical protein